MEALVVRFAVAVNIASVPHSWHHGQESEGLGHAVRSSVQPYPSAYHPYPHFACPNPGTSFPRLPTASPDHAVLAAEALRVVAAQHVRAHRPVRGAPGGLERVRGVCSAPRGRRSCLAWRTSAGWERRWTIYSTIVNHRGGELVLPIADASRLAPWRTKCRMVSCLAGVQGPQVAHSQEYRH